MTLWCLTILNVETGTFIEQHKINGWVTTLQWFAHRTILPILVFQVVVTKDESNVKSQSQDSTAKSVDTKSNIKDSLTIELDVSRTTTSEDIDLEELTSEFTNARWDFFCEGVIFILKTENDLFF